MPVLLPRARRRHRRTAGTPEQPAQDVGRVATVADLVLAALIEQRLRPVEDQPVDDGRMLGREDLVAGGHQAEDDGITQHPEHIHPRPEVAFADPARLEQHPFRESAGPVQVPGHGSGAALLEVEVEEIPDERRLHLVRHELPVDQVVADRGVAAGPAALPARCPHGVPHPVGDEVLLQLGETHEQVQDEPAQALAGIELLGDRAEAHAVGVEELDQLGKVEERAAQAVDSVNDHSVDPAGLDVLDQPLEGRPAQRPTAVAVVGVPLGHLDPARLLGDEGGAGVELRVDRGDLIVAGRDRESGVGGGTLDGGWAGVLAVAVAARHRSPSSSPA